MFLKKIILKNFKSFKGKVVFDFPHLITAVIGPNGSGKSNIVDAIRWALGEQSFKNIRVERGQDLIFSGNTKNASAAFCEAELIFDNQQKIFNSDYGEISILRRTDKEGNNSYFLNHKACRLKDIIDLTAGAKIGLKGFSIINQGAVENILLVSSQERRIMLEEILGLKNIELKKEEAQRKLDETNRNLEKTLALGKEILPHLRSLKRQVGRWERRDKIQEELSEIEKQYFANILHSINQEIPSRNQNLNALIQQLNSISGEIKQKEDKLLISKEKENQGLESKIQNITRDIISLQNKKSVLLRELGRQETALNSPLPGKDLEQKIFNVKSQLGHLLTIQDIALIHNKIKKIIEDLKNIFGSAGQDNKEKLDNIKTQLDDLEKELINKNALLKRQEQELHENNKDFRGAFEQIANLRGQKEELLQIIQREEILTEKYRLRLEDFKRRVQEAGLEFGTIEQYYYANKNTIITDNDKFILLERQVTRIKREISEIGAEDENVVKEYQETSERYEFLSQQMEDLRHSSQDLKLLIQELAKEIEKTFEHSLNEINKDFNRYFRIMFSGGLAKLEQLKKQKNYSVSGEENDQESNGTKETYWGVDIKIDIPKTELKHLEMLSGGEKTLVAIALLFAIISQSNPPLLVLDEIDAALDEDNSQRFSKILKELCWHTQFIIITHNRMTMSVAEVIYGVTLGQENSSQLLSIKLEESDKILVPAL